MSVSKPGSLVVAGVTLALLSCSQESPVAKPVAVASPIFFLSASIQELMHDLVDPSADGVWESVGTTITAQGIVDRQPRTDDEWRQVKVHATLLIEATNLLAMDGRHLVPVGGKVLDEGHEGVLTAVEGQKKLDEQHEAFVQFAGSLRETGKKMLAAIEAKDPVAMLEVGTEMDGVCESCHTMFWYPNQVYPSVKNGITTLEEAQAGAH